VRTLYKFHFSFIHAQCFKLGFELEVFCDMCRNKWIQFIIYAAADDMRYVYAFAAIKLYAET